MKGATHYGVLSLNHGLGTDHTETHFSNTNLSFINQEKDERWLNMNWAGKKKKQPANSFADVILRGEKMEVCVRMS